MDRSVVDLVLGKRTINTNDDNNNNAYKNVTFMTCMKCCTIVLYLPCVRNKF